MESASYSCFVHIDDITDDLFVMSEVKVGDGIFIALDLITSLTPVVKNVTNSEIKLVDN